MNGSGRLSVASVILTERNVEIVSSIPAGSETTCPGPLWLLIVPDSTMIWLASTELLVWFRSTENGFLTWSRTWTSSLPA